MRTTFRQIVKNSLTTVLKPVDLRLSTTEAQRRETARLRVLQNKDHWSSPVYDQGLRFDTPQYLTLLTQVFARYTAEYKRIPPEEVGDSGWYQSIDAEVRYSV